MWMQQFLNGHGFQVAASGAGSPGNETSYFGAATKAAVIKFQNANAADILAPVGLTAGTGNWLAATRAKVNAICAGGNAGTGNNGNGNGGTTAGGSLMISAGTQPANSLAPKGASRVPFTTFTLTNNSGAAVTVNGVTVQRTGLASDAAFSGVVLVDSNGLQIGIARTFNSNHMATVGDTWTIQPGQSQTLTVAGNMAADLSSYSGQVASIAVTGVNVASGTVGGALPITGAMQTLNNSLTVGTVTVGSSSFDPSSAQTKSIGDTGVKFAGVRVTAGSAEDVKLYSVRFRMNGSASGNDLSNLMINVNGTAYPAAWSADGRYVSASFPGGVLIQKGVSADVYISGDVSGSNSSGRVVQFDIDKQADIYVVGQTYGYGILPTISSVGTISTASTHGSNFAASNGGQPFFQGATVTIQGGTVTTIQNATSVVSGNIAVNVPNQTLGGFQTNFTGEPVTVQNMVLNVSTSSGNTAALRNVTIVDKNGAVVAGPVDEAGNGTLTFTDSVTFPIGIAVYTVKGTVATGASNGDTYQLKTTPSSGWTNVTGQSTGNTVSLSGFGQITMSTQTVRGLSLTVAMSATPASGNIVAGAQNQLFANIQLDASQSGEDVRINSLPIELTTSGLSSLGSITGCQLNDSTGNALNYGSNIVNTLSSSTANTFNLNNSLTVTKGTTATLGLKCNVNSSAAGTYRFSTAASDSVTVSGVTSGNSTTINPSTSNAGLMTVAAGSAALSVNSASKSYYLTSGGTSNVELGVYTIRPTSEAMTLSELGVHLSSGNAADITGLTFWNGSTQVGTASFTGSSAYATSTNISLNLPADQDTIITVKGNLSDIGINQGGVEGDVIKLDPSGAKVVGQASGQLVIGMTGSGVLGVGMFNTFPHVALGTLPTSGVTDGKLIDVNVTADSANSLGVKQLVFSVSSSSGTLVGPSVTLYAFSGSCSGAAAPGTTNGVVGSATLTQVSGSYFATTTASTPIQVGAGQTVCFELQGTVSPNGTTYNVNTKLVGDGTLLSGVSTATVLDASSAFVWSPNATGTVTSASANDYSNGYGVYSGTGLSQNRTQ